VSTPAADRRRHPRSLAYIVVLDGGMGTMVQARRFDEAAWRGARFAAHGKDVKGNTDLLVLTQPRAIEEIHLEYLRAGADVIETDTFTATRIAQADYGLEDVVRELNVEAARIARRAADRVTAEDPSRPRFVAGSIGPTNRTASMSPKVEDPAFRAVTFGELVVAYREQVEGLLEGGWTCSCRRPPSTR
jgi:5-methyltetrahydrofolate--homocysteine methyltransferase